MVNRSLQVLLAFGTMTVANAALAALPGASSHACAEVVEPDARLLCYDKAFPPVAGARTAEADDAAKRTQAAEEFGLNKQQLFSLNPDRRDYTPDEIASTVSKVIENASGQRVVTLANGQSWLLIEATSRGRLSTGDAITIRGASMGSYLLFTKSRVPLRARRLR